jgi:hypothetical protein
MIRRSPNGSDFCYRAAVDHHPLQSSNVKSCAYDAQTKELHIRFHSGKTYSYSGVPYDVHAQLMLAGSAGKFVGQHIAPHYASKQV